MKRGLLFVMVFLVFGMPVCAQDSYRIEVLQVSKINPFDWAYEGFVEELERNGIVQGQNLVINRRIIDADADAGLWKKVGILMKIKGAVSDIIASEPDLVLTISSPATKYSKDKFISAGIPVVFTGVAVPQAIGCASVRKAGPGFTGASLYLDPTDAFKITKLALPNLTKMGIVHSDDENAVAFVQEATAKAAALDITILSREVGKSDSPVEAARAHRSGRTSLRHSHRCILCPERLPADRRAPIPHPAPADPRGLLLPCRVLRGHSLYWLRVQANRRPLRHPGGEDPQERRCT